MLWFLEMWLKTQGLMLLADGDFSCSECFQPVVLIGKVGMVGAVPQAQLSVPIRGKDAEHGPIIRISRVDHNRSKHLRLYLRSWITEKSSRLLQMDFYCQWQIFISTGNLYLDLIKIVLKRNFENPNPERITPKKLWSGFLWREGIGKRISSFSCLRDRQWDFAQPQQPGSVIHGMFQVLPQQGISPPEREVIGKELHSHCPSLNIMRLFQTSSVNRNCLWTLKYHAPYHSGMALISWSWRSKQEFYYKLCETHLLPSSHSVAGNKIQSAKMIHV